MNNIHGTAVKRIDGTDITLDQYRGDVLLIVNVASKCGLTPQYAGLEKLYQDKQAQGLKVLGFPANNFAGQELGSDAEIGEFCSLNYDVHFPLFSKISVKGPDRHSLYAKLTQAYPQATGDGPFREKLKGYGVEASDPTDVLWNFEKFLVNRRGDVVARFAPDITADDPRLLQAIDAELAER